MNSLFMLTVQFSLRSEAACLVVCGCKSCEHPSWGDDYAGGRAADSSFLVVFLSCCRLTEGNVASVC